MRVWAPGAKTVELLHGDERHELSAGDGGWWQADLPLAAGDDYRYSLDGGQGLPDPRSRWQPAGVDGPSRLVDPDAFGWTDRTWHGVQLAGSTVYELHVGTFTPEGSFDAAVGHLDHLVDLGVHLIELLPVNAYPGRAGWGYDGVDLYAVQDSYGGPAGLARFVDAAHGKGLGVILDVVYNHLGPAGNYLPQYGPYFTEAHHTPWGAAVNYDVAGSDEVRRFVLDNATGWLRDFHLDGLRLDAVHAIVDTSAVHLLEELAGEVLALSAHLHRPLSLIAESDLNDPRLVAAPESGGYGLTAQWSDDFHHALHVTLTGERDGYYADYAGIDDLAAAYTGGWVYDGRYSPSRGRRHGRPLPAEIPSHRLLGYLQDHDQVGNRATGDRSSMLMSTGLLKAGAALVLLSPFTPMLWMGEEWGAGTPWQYFTDHTDPQLAEAVRTGRRSEFASFGWKPEDVPDPQDPETVRRSTLDWSEPEREPHAGVLAWHRELLALRRAEPAFTDPSFAQVSVRYDAGERWFVLGRGPAVRVLANFSGERRAVPLDGSPLTVLASSAPGFTFADRVAELAPESVLVLRLA